MSRHYQFEANLSLTGANADYRTPLKPTASGPAIIALYNAVATATSNATVSGGSDAANIKQAAADLMRAGKNALVVSGSNDPAVQNLIAGINNMLGSYGTTISFDRAPNYKSGDEAAFAQLVADAGAGSKGFDRGATRAGCGVG